jgi:hypothetical protein|tara:strand:- start:349 stop:564 length:216 start_codon:yes stop_codon:yes gene_type:complete
MSEMNNIVLYHLGVKISIAQHNVVGMTVQEVGVYMPKGKRWEIFPYGKNIFSLTEALNQAKMLIEKDNKGA